VLDQIARLRPVGASATAPEAYSPTTTAPTEAASAIAATVTVLIGDLSKIRVCVYYPPIT
jgi:hypothetical protein